MSGDTSIITSTSGCGEIRQEIQMKDLRENIICLKSDFDTRLSGKKICLQNGVELQVVESKTLRVTVNSLENLGTYYLWLFSYHIDSTGSKILSLRATPLTLTISGSVKNKEDCNYPICNLKIVG